MATYSMQQVESLTGISAHSLRKWESRYSFISPKRSNTNIRLYSDEQLQLLLNVSILSRNGFRISQIDAMKTSEISLQVEKLMEKDEQDHQDEIASLTIAMTAMDEDAFDKTFTRLSNKHGLLETIISVIYPFLNRVGLLWGINRIVPAQEHFITNLIRQKIIVSIDKISVNKNAKCLIMFLPEGENHEIGLILAHYIAKSVGWRVIYLGQNVPYSNIREAIQITKASMMFSVSTIPLNEKRQTELYELAENLNIDFMISGSKLNISNINKYSQVHYVMSPDEFIKLLEVARSNP